MSILKKTLAIALTGLLLYVPSIMAIEEDKPKIKHSVIELKRQISKTDGGSINNNATTDLKVVTDGVAKTITITQDELNDEYLLAEKLSDLDDDTKEIVLNTLKNKNFTFHSNKNKEMSFSQDVDFAFMGLDTDGEANVTIIKSIDDLENVSDVEILQELGLDGNANSIQTMKNVTVISAGDGEHFVGSLKGHHKAIVKLIEKGEFTRDELDQIQEALDAKR